jgi:hypothetical protein
MVRSPREKALRKYYQHDDRGLAAARAALRIGGVLAVWSAREDRRFEQRLRSSGFTVEVERVRGRLNKGGPRHGIFLGHNSPEAVSKPLA